MNIALDGLSGVGKTYYGQLFAKKHEMTFFEFLPDINEVEELSLHAETIHKHSRFGEPVLIEGSLIMSEIVKFWMYKNNKITFKELLQILDITKRSVHKYGVVYLTDSKQNILAKRKKRGRKYEYLPGMKDLSSIDKHIIDNFHSYAVKEKIPVVVCNVNGKSDDEVLQMIEDAIIDLLT